MINCTWHSKVLEKKGGMVVPVSDFLLKQFKHLKKGLFSAFIILMFVCTVSFSNNISQADEAVHKVTHIEQTLHNLKGAMKIDSLRQRSINKILSIINKYNQKLPSKEKYDIVNEIYNMSMKYKNLNVDLICATITHESGLTWRPDIKSWAGAMGLMQIMPATGMFLSELERIKWTNAEDILYNPIHNIRLGCRYLSMLIETYQLDGGLAAYNGGETRAALWLARGRDNNVLYKETQRYIPAVLKFYEMFQRR